MNNDIFFQDDPELPLLTTQQRNLLSILKKHEIDRYRVGDWYLAAVYAVHSRNNPDRLAQAAQSLRELIEKLPLIVLSSDIPVFRPETSLPNLRNNLRIRFWKDVERYDEDWRGKTIDSRLDKTLKELRKYLELSQTPSRTERIQSVIIEIDPMADHLRKDIIDKKRELFKTIWLTMEKFAHHGSNNQNDEEDFLASMQDLENLLLDLFAPVTAEDNAKIRSIISKPLHTIEDHESIYNLIIRRGVNQAYFFLHNKEASWFPFLRERGFFRNPPNAKSLEDGHVEYPTWPELVYLKNISKCMPDEVLSVVLELPQVNNPRVYDLILEIALDLDGNRSVKLMPKLHEYIELNVMLIPNRFTELLVHWRHEMKTQEAIELAKTLIRFHPGTH